MKTVVIDAGVAAKWFLPEPDAPAALQWLDGPFGRFLRLLWQSRPRG